MQNVGKELFSRRIILCYTLKQASDITGLSPKKIQRIEEGKDKLTTKLVDIFNKAYDMRLKND